jgi:hypothetical protein
MTGISSRWAAARSLGLSREPRSGRECVAMTAFALIMAGSAASAQDPVRLPVVVIKGEPGSGVMTGVVRDVEGFTLEDAEVSIPAARRRTSTRADGSFRFDDLPRGTYDVRARKIGYSAQIRRIKVDSLGGIGVFELRSIPRALPAIVSSAPRLGLSGTVGDTAYHSLDSAEVRVLGEGLATHTDSAGSFFLPVKSGNYMVAITKPGFADKVTSVTIPSDSGQRVTVFLQPSSGRKSRNEFWNLADLRERMAWRNRNMTAFYTREEMEKRGIEWVYDAVRMATVVVGLKTVPSVSCEVLIDGGPRTGVLNSLTIDEVEGVEVYGKGVPGECPIIYVWMR